MTKRKDIENQVLDIPCGYCGGEIKGRRADSKYCSAECRVTAEKRRSKERRGGGEIVFRGPNDGRSLNKRAYALSKKYGITIEQYNELLEKQDHCCAICDKHENEFKTRLAVDHNHETGEIRGLLCTYCNHRLIGRHRDGTLLRKMADYVDQGTGWFVPSRPRTKKRKPRKN